MEPFYQRFQYKVRKLNCKENLFKWKIIESSTCSFCRAVDTLEHHLNYCNVSAIFWEELSKWCKHILKVKFKFTVCEVLFGLQLGEDPALHILNYVILIGKWFLNNKKTENKTVHFSEFLELIISKLIILNNICREKNKEFQHFFDKILESLQET